MPVVIPAGGSGSAATYNQHTIFGEYPGPTSYPTGGFVIDMSLSLSSLNILRLQTKTVGALPVCDLQVAMNSPTAGKATVKVLSLTYDKITAIGNVQNQPSGVTVQASSGGTSSSENSHTHSIDHDHGSFTSAGPTALGAGITSDVLGASINTHTHTLDLPNLTGNSGAGTSHNHTDNSIYAHTHAETRATTNLVRTELANATNLSTTVFNLVATGVKV